MAFANMAQSTAYNCAAVTNLMTANITFTKQVVVYSNHLSTKEADNVALQTAMKNLQGEVKKLKAGVSTLKSSGHSSGASATKHNSRRPEPKWNREVQAQHSTSWSTPYYWIHWTGGHSGAECKRNKPCHKAEATAKKKSGVITFGLTQGLLNLGSLTITIKVTNNELNLEILANFSQTKNTCSRHPPTRIEQYGIADSG